MNEMISWKARWSSDEIRAMLIEQFDSFWRREVGIERSKLKQVEQAARLPHAVIVSGLRRVGKSTLLAQQAHRLGGEAFYYVNFEDDRLIGFRAEDANDLYQALLETFGERKIFILDEVQNIPGWEHFVRRFMELGFKFYISGSNASLLSRELGTRLTGRYVAIELLPFSFREYLRFREIPVPDFGRATTVERALLNAALRDYMQSGGIPDALKYPELPLLRALYDDVLYRDIAARYGLNAVAALRELAHTLFSNPAGLVTYTKLKDQFRLGSVNTVSSYIDYMQNSWLVFAINQYAYSIKRQQTAPKKIYCIDTGMIQSVGFRFSANNGKLFENIAFLALRQQEREIYYLQTGSGYEVDFYLPGRRQLIQVTQRMDQPETRARELRAVEEALQAMPVEDVLILTDENENTLDVGGRQVRIQSIAEWLATQDV